ncbi:unnamed protein product, partial [Polarella glacialis]
QQQQQRRGNCGLDIPRVKNAEDFRHYLGGEDTDLEDKLWSGDFSKAEYKALKRRCAKGDGPSCTTFGIELEQWNLTVFNAVSFGIGQVGYPCKEDASVWPPPCGENVLCKRIDGELRIVGLSAKLTRKDLQALARLPHLFALELDLGVSPEEDFSDLFLPDSLRLVSIRISKDPEMWKKATSLLRAQGKIRSVHVDGVQDILRWLQVDLSELCGLDLLRFSGYVFEVVGSTFPACWSKMVNLQSVYCSNCMMTQPPTALKGLQSMKSFVAFRQSEMTPCAMKENAKSPEQCKPSWETRFGFKGAVRESTGAWGDFQEGPSFKCRDASYSFHFEEFLQLGWTNVRKVWLDGNFLTGGIPDNISEIWPALQSLDLYDNAMSGPLPQSLFSLELVKLQLQGNNFSGQLPPGVVGLLNRDSIYFGVADNPALGGCLPKEFIRGERGFVAGTRIEACNSSHNEL